MGSLTTTRNTLTRTRPCAIAAATAMLALVGALFVDIPSSWAATPTVSAATPASSTVAPAASAASAPALHAAPTALPAAPAAGATITGRVVDPLGAAVPAARLTLLRNGTTIGEKTADPHGEFVFDDLAPDRYVVRAQAQGFETRTSAPIFAGPGDRLTIEIALSIGPLQQELTVTAAATELPTSRSGAPVTVLDSQTLDALGKSDLLEALRLVPGANIVQIGARGGVTSLFIRGGNANFAKVLIDGVPANDIGGSFDVGTVATTGIDRVEVLRQSNSVLYGSDALSGVVNITTRRGRTLVPEASYSIDGGNLSTMRQDASFGGAVRRFDYFSDYSHFRTDNDVPNNGYRKGTYAGRFGVALGRATDLSATVRRVDSTYGIPNAIEYYGVPDDQTQDLAATYVGVAAESQLSPRLQSVIRFASMSQHVRYDTPAPIGEPFDPFGSGPNYLGNLVTIHGANGYSVTGRAILDFGDTAYPSIFTTDTTRRSVLGQATYHLLPALDVSGGGRVEHESGYTQFNADSRSQTTRTNGGGFVEAQGRVLDRVYANAGVGVEHNEVFGTAVTPRASVAVYLRTASTPTALGDTKLTLNAGKGIKAPTIAQELSSLFGILQTVPAATRASVAPIGPERSRSFDVGMEQGLMRNHARVRAAFFDNQFSNLIEFVSKNALPRLGVSPDVAAASGFGAYVNSSSFRARGLETSGEVAVRHLRASASYTYLDAVVNQSFASSALKPAINPAFPAIPIGAFAPLVGARPFRRPANSGNLLVTYNDGPLLLAFAGYFVGKEDDSTFLFDSFFGNSMLLPNKDLVAAYHKLDASAAYRIHPRLRWYLSVENLSDEHYDAAAGFPALGRTFRTGVTVNVGGDKTP